MNGCSRYDLRPPSSRINSTYMPSSILLLRLKSQVHVFMYSYVRFELTFPLNYDPLPNTGRRLRRAVAYRL